MLPVSLPVLPIIYSEDDDDDPLNPTGTPIEAHLVNSEGADTAILDRINELEEVVS